MVKPQYSIVTEHNEGMPYRLRGKVSGPGLSERNGKENPFAEILVYTRNFLSEPGSDNSPETTSVIEKVARTEDERSKILAEAAERCGWELGQVSTRWATFFNRKVHLATYTQLVDNGDRAYIQFVSMAVGESLLSLLYCGQGKDPGGWVKDCLLMVSPVPESEAYTNEVYKQIQQVWARKLKVRNEQKVLGLGKVVLSITINESGKVTKCEVVESSAGEATTSFCQEAISEAKLPPIPEGLRSSTEEPTKQIDVKFVLY